jgi:hypothetical protein
MSFNYKITISKRDFDEIVANKMYEKLCEVISDFFSDFF